MSRIRFMRADDCLDEVSHGIGASWKGRPVYGASRSGLTPAKEALGKQPERYKPVEAGTVFYNPMRILLGSIAMLDDGEEPGITSPDYVVVRGRPGVLHHRVFYYWLRSQEGEQLIRELARGGVRERILFKRLCDGQIPVLPWHVQEQLAEQLAIFPQALAAAQARLDAAEALPAAYLREAFGPTAPFSADPLVPSDAIRAGWHWHRLTAIARLATGHTPSRREPAWWGGDIQWLQLPDIRAVDGRRVFNTLEQTNELGLANSSSVLLPEGTVCMSRTASVAFVTIMGRPMATSQDFVNWVCGPDLDPDFLMYLILRCRREIRELGSGATHHSIYFDTVEDFSICIPPIAEQRRVAGELASRIRETERMTALLREELDCIGALPAAILRSAFDGHS